MAKQERRRLARYMVRHLVTMLKANGHKETKTKTKAISSQRWQPMSSTQTSQEPFRLPDLGIKSSWRHPTFQMTLPFPLLLVFLVLYQFQELVTWFSSNNPSLSIPSASGSFTLQPFTHLCQRGFGGSYTNVSDTDYSLRTQICSSEQDSASFK